MHITDAWHLETSPFVRDASRSPFVNLYEHCL
jgi:hypothetical protein